MRNGSDDHETLENHTVSRFHIPTNGDPPLNEYGNSADIGGKLQRATSAPPVSYNVSEWALNGEAMSPQQGITGSIDPEYMYYYYAPTALNPRQPKNISSHSPKGSSLLSSNKNILEHDLLLGESSLLPQHGAITRGVSPGLPGTHWDPPLEAYQQNNDSYIENRSDFGLSGSTRPVGSRSGTPAHFNGAQNASGLERHSSRSSVMGNWAAFDEENERATKEEIASLEALQAKIKELSLGSTNKLSGAISLQNQSSNAFAGMYNRENGLKQGYPIYEKELGYDEYRIRGGMPYQNRNAEDSSLQKDQVLNRSRLPANNMDNIRQLNFRENTEEYYGQPMGGGMYMDPYSLVGGYAHTSPSSSYHDSQLYNTNQINSTKVTATAERDLGGYLGGRGYANEMEVYYRKEDLGGGGAYYNRNFYPRDAFRDRRAPPMKEEIERGNVTLLDDFRGSIGKGRKWELADLAGSTVQFCRDQHGSRFIQQKLEFASESERSAFFEEVLPHAQSLMTDVFGNYVIQKLFDHGGPDQRVSLASYLVGHAVQLSLQMYGCRVVQKALEFASIDTLIALVSEFNGQVMTCVQDQNGNHVIQKCIEVVCETAKTEGPFLYMHIQYIIDAFKGNVHKLSTHAYGCRVIQRILEHCIDEQRDPVLEEIRTSFGALIQDQYGNYVIQHVLKHGRPEDREMLMGEVRNNLLPYSQHKFASNVVEKCLQYGTREERGTLIYHLTHGHTEGQASLLQVMVCDPYANYVVQKIIDVADAEQREGIIMEIRAHSSQLKRYTYGKHIISRLEKISGKKM
eukprot:CAMPEP_0171469440 /NCGR_PEP_ID=MMETSP0945-20130129/11293_1 /TAXON_ID=109269 /ORGANISM="Vaucheria litorea, Strain CCMP2940" /LENGTH=797 /DNA_ID=CAMNT_0011998599 /DNA_START=153 /DNA_END=2547 /DNA_ORIENTATION=+